MRVFYSGKGDQPNTRYLYHDCMPNRLVSIHGKYFRYSRDWLASCADLPAWSSREVMVDSGAFSAFMEGHPITLEEVTRAYDVFATRFSNKFKHLWFINLDVIPGAGPGIRPTEDEIARALDKSDDNLVFLQRRFGDVILPVFHRLESWERLEVIKSQAKFFCAAPGQQVGEAVRVEWAKRVLAQCKGWKVHGLAATSERIMVEVDWYSVDSASWARMGGFGIIYTATSGRLRSVYISAQSPRRNQIDMHYDTLPAMAQRAIRDEFESMGYTLDGMREKYLDRMVYNIKKLEHFLQTTPRRDTGIQGALFNP